MTWVAQAQQGAGARARSAAAAPVAARWGAYTVRARRITGARVAGPRPAAAPTSGQRRRSRGLSAHGGAHGCASLLLRRINCPAGNGVTRAKWATVGNDGVVVTGGGEWIGHPRVGPQWTLAKGAWWWWQMVAY